MSESIVSDSMTIHDLDGFECSSMILIHVHRFHKKVVDVDGSGRMWMDMDSYGYGYLNIWQGANVVCPYYLVGIS